MRYLLLIISSLLLLCHIDNGQGAEATIIPNSKAYLTDAIDNIIKDINRAIETKESIPNGKTTCKIGKEIYRGEDMRFVNLIGYYGLVKIIITHCNSPQDLCDWYKHMHMRLYYIAMKYGDVNKYDTWNAFMPLLGLDVENAKLSKEIIDAIMEGPKTIEVPP